MNITLPYTPNPIGDRQQYRCKLFSSDEKSVTYASLGAKTKVGSAVTDLDIHIKRASATKEVAFCIPSDPMEICALTDRYTDFQIRQWWADWRHNIALHFGTLRSTGRNIGPLFFVLEKTDAEQYANCYYKGREKETNLKVSGTMANIAQFSIQAGFSCAETGNFGFKTSPYLPGKRWVIFMQSEKLFVILFAKFKSLISQIWQ